MLTNLRKLNEIPSTLNTGAIDRAIQSFLDDNRMDPGHTNIKGLKQQITDAIASVVIFKNNPSVYFWAAEEDGEVVSWTLTHASKDVDNTLCYWMTDAWVAPTYRTRPIVKEWFQLMRDDAKRLMCKHILIPSSRGSEAYCRFLGKGWHQYLVILKEDI